jgi:DNA modification methylase
VNIAAKRPTTPPLTCGASLIPQKAMRTFHLPDVAKLLGFAPAAPKNRVIHGDCVKVLREKIAPSSVDFAFTDPPYLVSYHDRQGRAVANDSGGGDWIYPAFAGIYRVLKPDAFCVTFYGWNKLDVWFAAWRRAGFRPCGHLVFIKNYASGRGVVEYRHENAFVLTKGRGRPPRVLPDVLNFGYSGNRFHPTEKPVSALMPVIEAFSDPGQVVLDPFAGSGSTLLAAKTVGRRYIGIELDERHARTAFERTHKAA